MVKHRFGLVCALFACLAASTFSTISAQGDPSTLPRIQFSDLTYLGGFRLPEKFMNGDGFTIGGHPLAFNASRNSLFIGSRAGNVAEVAIPGVVNSNDVTKLQFASFLQGFYDPTEGNMWQVATTGAGLGGLLVVGDRVYGNGSIYYDSNNTQRLSHFSRSTTLSTPSFTGMKQVWEDAKAGFVSGYMSAVPPEWQQRLGGIAVTGQCCVPITWRTSWGPSAFVFNPADINTKSKVPAAPLLYYPLDHHNLGHWDASGPVYGGTTQITGVAILAGTRTALYFGRNGTGPFCYGNGTGDQSRVGATGPDGEIFCYDPTSTAKGQHAYPYNYQIWAYDLNDLAAVKAGTKQPWEVKPYGVWPFNLPFPEPQVEIGGVAYDAARQILYVSQLFADKDGYGYRPIIHALKVGAGAVGTPLSSVDTTPLPPLPTGNTPSSWVVSAVALTSQVSAPQPAGSTIQWTAAPAGGAGPHEYKWLVHNGYAWSTLGTWSTSNTLNWTPSTANPSYRVGVWVRSAGNVADQAEASASVDFAITGSTTTSAPPAPSAPSSYWKVNAVTLAANRVAPQPAGTAIQWTATSSGGAGPHQYKWLVHNGVQWSVSGTWSTSNTFTWTPAVANPGYRVGVWVKSAGNTADQAEETSSADFAVSTASSTAPPATVPPSTTPPPSATTPTDTTTPARLWAVLLTANKPAPQPRNTTIRFTAVPNGGATPQQYKWLVHNGVQWAPLSGWSTSNTFDWTPATSNAAYRIGVWVRSAGNTVDAGETTASIDFRIDGAAAPPVVAPPVVVDPPPTTTPTAARLSAVTLIPNRAAPQPVGTSVTFTAVATGGAAPQQYKWLVHDGQSWKVIGDWTTSSTFNWEPVVANAQYRFGVWVRSAGNTADGGEVTASIDFAISAAAPLPPPTTTTQPRLTAVALGSNKIAPQSPGSTVTFTAIPNGGTAPQQYKWLIHDGTRWAAVTGWTTSNTFNWTTAQRNSHYRIGVWVRAAGNTVDAGEVTASIDFPIR